jgi:plasmid stabilization system protein ParE
MKRELLFHASVQTDIREVLDYYEKVSPRLVDDFWEELHSAFEYARFFPERHHFDASGRRRSNLKRFPYHFLFKSSDSQIKVIVIRHNAQNSQYGSRRE